MGASASSTCREQKDEAACNKLDSWYECKWETKCKFVGRSLSDRMTENAQPIDSSDAGILRAIDDNRWD